MLLPIFALLATFNLAFAASPAQTYCAEDNLLRAFQHTLTPASSYCVTATGYPTFLAVTSYPATRLSSACSCLSRFPTDPTVCTPGTLYSFSGASTTPGISANLLLTISLSQPCSSGYRIVNICGTYRGLPVTFNPSYSFGGPDYCFFPSTNNVGKNGVDFSTTSAIYNLYNAGVNDDEIFSSNTYEDYSNGFQSVACGSAGATCPS